MNFSLSLRCCTLPLIFWPLFLYHSLSSASFLWRCSITQWYLSFFWAIIKSKKTKDKDDIFFIYQIYNKIYQVLLNRNITYMRKIRPRLLLRLSLPVIVRPNVLKDKKEKKLLMQLISCMHRCNKENTQIHPNHRHRNSFFNGIWMRKSCNSYYNDTM